MEQKYYIVTKYGYINKFDDKFNADIYHERHELKDTIIFDHFPTEEEYYKETVKYYGD